MTDSRSSSPGFPIGEIPQTHDASGVAFSFESAMAARDFSVAVKQEADQILGRIETCDVSYMKVCVDHLIISRSVG